MVKEMTVAARDLRAGDIVVCIGIAVVDVQSIGAAVIVDLADKTATAPIPSNVAVKIRRAE